MMKEFTEFEQNPEIILTEILNLMTEASQEEKDKFIVAWNFLIDKTKTHIRSCGQPYYLHPARVVQILIAAKMDIECVISGLLHNILSLENVTEDEIKTTFGETIFKIVNDTSRITGLKINISTLQQADAIRKMLFAMIDDVRVILVKLADRLDRMRNLKNVNEKIQKAISSEVMDIWAPLADRLGMQTIKNELEDLSLKFSNPDVFQQIKAIVSHKKNERASYLETAVKSIYQASEKNGIKVSVSSRAKHFYSIYKKMQKRNVEANKLYDLLALRIICNTNSECYTLIGIVHSLWKPMEGRFKDYIAMPKSNGYQSLHTTVICQGRPLEIQIRTEQMHNQAEHGVASHWLYKKGTNRDKVDVSNLSIFNQLQSLKDNKISDTTFFANLKEELLGDKIFVFTPLGDVIQLPAGSNAIDFAYAVHSAVGEKIVGAKADGRIIPLTQPLKNTQIIEILTNPQAHPTENQLKVIHTSKARQKIHSWLMANDPTFIDKESELRKSTENLFQNIHSKQIQEEKRKKYISDKNNLPNSNQKNSAFTGEIKIDNTKNVLYKLAGCCSPKPGDPIVGYVSKNRGIMIHKADCLTFHRIANIENRMVLVEWIKKDISKSSKRK